MNDRLKQLYQEVILQHSKQPFQYEKREDADLIIEANNPVCGDRFTLYCDVKDGKIENLSFYGHGCAISKASTSILVKKLMGKSLEEILDYAPVIQQIIDPQNEEIVDDPELAAFEAARFFPERSTCVTLSWERV